MHEFVSIFGLWIKRGEYEWISSERTTKTAAIVIPACLIVAATTRPWVLIKRCDNYSITKVKSNAADKTADLGSTKVRFIEDAAAWT